MAFSKKKTFLFIAGFLVLLIIILPISAYFIANYNAKSNVSEFTQNFKGICDIKYGNVSYNILNRHLIVENININCNSEKIADIKKAEFNHIVRSKPIPSNIQADITGGTLYNKAALFKDYGKAAADMGYDNINFQGRITYTIGKASKEFNIVTLDINATDFGSIKGEAKVVNAYDDNMTNIIYNIQNNPASFYITFEDKGLKNKVLEKYAEVNDSTVEQVKEYTPKAVYKRALDTDNFTKANYAQLEKFLISSNSLSLKLAQEDNISISSTVNTLDFTGYRKLLNSFKNLKVEIIAK